MDFYSYKKLAIREPSKGAMATTDAELVSPVINWVCTSPIIMHAHCKTLSTSVAMTFE